MGPSPGRLFTLLPQQNGFTNRYMPIDTQALAELWRMVLHHDPDLVQNIFEREEITKMLEGTIDQQRQLWEKSFHLHRLKGVSFPGLAVRNDRITSREFTFFMMTDGHGSSFVCERPVAGLKDPLTAENVPITDDTVFKAIDPGENDLRNIRAALELQCR